MTYPLKVIILEKVETFIVKKLSTLDEAKLDASITAIRYGNYESVVVKPIKGDIRELIIKKFRFLFFIEKDTIYFIGSFPKKTNKTPKLEIENALKIYKIITKI